MLRFCSSMIVSRKQEVLTNRVLIHTYENSRHKFLNGKRFFDVMYSMEMELRGISFKLEWYCPALIVLFRKQNESALNYYSIDHCTPFPFDFKGSLLIL